MVTTALVFDHRARTRTDQEGPIEVRVTINGKVRYASTGVKVLKKHWQHGVVVDQIDCDELNERLALILKKVNAYINECIKNESSLDLKVIRQKLISLDDNDKNDDFIEWSKNVVPTMPVSDSRKKHYYTLISRLTEAKIISSFDDLTVENVYKFDSWLHTLSKNIGSNRTVPICEGTIHNYRKNLKALINLALKMDKVTKNPFNKLVGVFDRGESDNIEYLTEKEMKRIEDLYLLPGELATARDMFVIQMYTGLSYSDMQSLDLSQYKNEGGKWIYNGERIKTGVGYVSQLLPPVVKVLNVYGWQVPRMAMQHYNEQLKILGKAAGIATRMHSHLARHTFATYMLRNGVKPENLQRMMGHTRISQSLHYAKVLAESVHEEFDRISELLNK